MIPQGRTQILSSTGVAYGFTSIDPNKPLDIRIVKDWGASGTHDKIPSVISYSETTTAGEEQWGLDLSPNALAMVNTKLELDVQDRKLGELELILHLLDGVNDLNFDDTIKKRGFPEYTEKAPEDGMYGPFNTAIYSDTYSSYSGL